MDIENGGLCMSGCDVCFIRCTDEKGCWSTEGVLNGILKDVSSRREGLEKMKKNPKITLDSIEFWEKQIATLEKEFMGILTRDKRFAYLIKE